MEKNIDQVISTQPDGLAPDFSSHSTRTESEREREEPIRPNQTHSHPTRSGTRLAPPPNPTPPRIATPPPRIASISASHRVCASNQTKSVDCIEASEAGFMTCGEAVPFTVRDAGVALGLQTEGSVIDLHPNDKRVRLSDCYTRFHKDYFGMKNEVTRKSLQEILKRLACAEGCKKSDDFVALMVLYIFSTVLFPWSNKLVTTSLIPYLTEIKHLKDL
ncbi:hypothetical protein FCM35_KLT01701 [Carex littledalei]|uniref:Uncharacterized protein n=1 Tax=Carex littledalei TaxID=544730 RepID=A0A833QTW4_9POAL|nr:hypothetical protein FCM35_KLT01701 [Carex littledalei]